MNGGSETNGRAEIKTTGRPWVVPARATGLRLCKMVRDQLVVCESVQFARGGTAIDTTLRRAQIAGAVGPVGETGNFWADFLDGTGDWFETIALSRAAWNSLKNRWMRCKLEE